MKAWTVAAVALLLAGCAAVDPYRAAPIAVQLPREDALGACARRFAAIDEAIDARGMRDAAAPRIAGFPFLRVDRQQAALGAEIGSAGLDDPRTRAWLAALAALDAAARRHEIANAALAPATGADADALDRCRAQWLAAFTPQQLTELRATAQVPDDYSTGLRALGLYPLTRMPFAAGIRRWHEETRATFALDEASVPRLGQRRLYAPALPSPPAPGGGRPPRDALGLPRIDATLRAALLVRHAPLWDVDVHDANDRIGALVWQGTPPQLAVDAAQPAIDAQLAYARFDGRWQVQLVYTAWFAARPAESRFDVLAGPFDGVVWRVTLDDDLEPLVYDSIHPCGCYHLFFPTTGVLTRPAPDTLDEGMFAPQSAPLLRPGQRLRLRIAARTHYLERVAVADAGTPDAVYVLRDADGLRGLPLPGGGTRSVFDRDGFLPGSERLERAFFWPMGIASAGQMRQWGRHATAFVGRRHFDDPHLFEQYFERAGSSAPRAAALSGGRGE